jgi:hypothetical protein
MRRRPARSSSRSPPCPHPTDALLCVLTPSTAVEALRTPSGALKACLDEASPFEQHFAVRTALASRKIHDWLDELSDWPWPQGSTSAGFRPPPAKRRRLFEPRGTEEEREDAPETSYLGSLPAPDVARYETRVEEIQKGMDDLDLEDIKSHVLLSHIMPLSRPGTPFSDSSHSVASTMSFTKMQDISAVITAITVQSLPELAKLSGLLNTWSVRIVVLRKVPSVLMMIADAEIALQSGWAAIKVDPHGLSPERVDTSALSWDDFKVMNSVLQQKISDPGQDLDAMLDVLEGMVDTLPDEWLDRMDAVEKDYANWAATAEQRVREGEYPKPALAVQPKQQTSRPKIQIRPPSPTAGLHDDLESSAISSPTEERLQAKNSRVSSREPVDEDTEVSDSAHQDSDERTHELIHDDNEPVTVSFDGSFEEQAVAQGYEKEESGSALSELDRNIMRTSPAGTLEPSPLPFHKGLLEMDAEFSSFLESVHEEDEELGREPELPPSRFLRTKGSQNSIVSVAVHDADSCFSMSGVGASREQSVDLELPRLPDPDEPFSSDDLSPPGSPPLKHRQRSASTSFHDMPEISELPEDEAVTPPRSPPPYPDTIDLDAPFDYGTQTQASSPGRSVFSEGGDDLHRQIREVLKNLPNKIRFSTKPAINLNPPDLQLPTLSSLSSSRTKGKTSDPYRRSASAMSARSTMSSRASNHTWLLAPARVSRPQSRANSEVKIYYLSRSAGEAPMKLLVRCVGEHGERVMVRVGGGWADLGEYLKEYAIHHSRRSRGEGKVEVKDSTAKNPASRRNSSSSSRPASALERPVTPLMVRKTRRSMDNVDPSRVLPAPPETPMDQTWDEPDTPPSDRSDASHISRAVSNPNSSFLGMSGPHPKNRRVLSEESRQWVEDVKNKVRSASGGQRHAAEPSQPDGKFADLGKVGGTKRLYRKNFA